MAATRIPADERAGRVLLLDVELRGGAVAAQPGRGLLVEAAEPLVRGAEALATEPGIRVAANPIPRRPFPGHADSVLGVATRFSVVGANHWANHGVYLRDEGKKRGPAPSSRVAMAQSFESIEQFLLRGADERPEQRARQGVAPGKVTLTQRFAPSSTFIARAIADGVALAMEQLGGAGAEAAIERARGGAGAPLPTEARDAFAQSLGTPLEGVRVHTDSTAASAAAAVGARAFTIGSDIYFGRGEYDPGGQDGKLLLAHELVHTVQQAGGARTGETQFKLEVSEPGDALEQEAERLAPDVVAGRPVAVSGGGAAASRAIMRWVNSPADAVQARMYLQNAIRSAHDAAEIAGIVSALEAPNSSSGRVIVRLPGDSPMSIVDLDLPPLLEEARARQRALGGAAGAAGVGPGAAPATAAGTGTGTGTGTPARAGSPGPTAAPRASDATRPPDAAPEAAPPRPDVEAGARSLRAAIRQAETTEAIDAIRRALEYCTYDVVGDEVAVALEAGRSSQNVWVARSAVPGLRTEADQRRETIVRSPEERDRTLGRAYDAERADARAHEADGRRQLDEQQHAEAADRDARGLALVRAALAAHTGSEPRERIRDTLRAATAERGLYHPALPDRRRPELNAADRTTAIALAEQAVTEARAAERATGHCRAPEGDTTELTDEQRTDLREQIRHLLGLCNSAFHAAAQAVKDDLHSAASHDRDVAKLLFKIAFTFLAPELTPGFGTREQIAAFGAIGEYTAGQQANAAHHAHDADHFIAALLAGEGLGNEAISRDLNCHTGGELNGLRASLENTFHAGQAGHYETRIRTLLYNYQHQVAEIGVSHSGALDTISRGSLIWVVHGGEAHLAVAQSESCGLMPISISYRFQTWVFRDMARMALARDSHVDEVQMSDLDPQPAAPPSYVHRRGDPLADDSRPAHGASTSSDR
ncbi:MAG: DUF4157 domain-containing protein [Myxococcales bacterium]|nr:DUF4157 domain-containing protein [Myxococcales bacterium]